MKKLVCILLVCVLSFVIVSPTLAASKLELTPTNTWDTDMINSDSVDFTGKGVYVAVLDTGLAPNWKDYFPADQILTQYGKGFIENIKWDEKTQTFLTTGIVRETSFIGDTGSTHGTHVTSTIIGYNYYAPADAASGFVLPPIFVQGVASDVKIIPVKVLADYHIGKAHTDPVDYTDQHIVFGTDLAVATGIRYATDLAISKNLRPMIITMSLGGPTNATVIEDAIDYAIANGVIVVASAGNEGTDGMGYPGAYSQVISVGACGWKYEWYGPNLTAPPPRYRLWWLQDVTYGYNDLTENNVTLATQVYITNWSSRELAGQQLDVVAPGSWVRGPYPGDPGYSHYAWWSSGFPLKNPGNFYYLGGTSMAAPHVTGIVALMLQKNPTLTQGQVESILKTSALPIAPGSMTVFDLSPTPDFYTYTWGADATGAGLVQADSALAITPSFP